MLRSMPRAVRHATLDRIFTGDRMGTFLERVQRLSSSAGGFWSVRSMVDRPPLPSIQARDSVVATGSENPSGAGSRWTRGEWFRYCTSRTFVVEDQLPLGNPQCREASIELDRPA